MAHDPNAPLPTVAWDISPTTGGFIYTYSVMVPGGAGTHDLSHFGISFKCPDNKTLLDQLLAELQGDLQFTPNYSDPEGLIKWEIQQQDNKGEQWFFWMFSDRLPVEGTAVTKSSTDVVEFVVQVPGCVIIPEPTSWTLVLAGLWAVLMRRRR